MTIDWENLGFEYRPTNTYLRYTFRDGKWDAGESCTGSEISIPVAATALHYGQSAFEGLKAFSVKDGSVQIFRPFENAKRMRLAADRLHMAPVSDDMFVGAIRRLIKENRDFVPPHGHGASLYIRPLLFGSGPRIGIKPADEYTFIVLCIPVGNYYRSGVQSIEAMIMENFDRAAPFGLGHVKAAGNYVAGIEPSHQAAAAGFPICLYLDARERKYIEEFGTSNFVGITEDNRYVTPESPSILKSITNMCFQEIAKSSGMRIEVRPVPVEELESFVEIGACGTAVGLAPISAIQYGDRKIQINSNPGFGPKLKELYEKYRGIQLGDAPDEFSWLVPAQA